MQPIIRPGETKYHTFTVTKDDVASFHGKAVHQVCATFTLAREIEWSSRLFVIDIKDKDEEGIGTFLAIKHVSPAFIGDEVKIVATVKQFIRNELICTFTAKVNDRIIATGETGQKVLKREFINNYFNKLRSKSD